MFYWWASATVLTGKPTQHKPKEGDTMKRDIVILVTAKDKTEEIWVDGKLKFKHTYNYAEHAIAAGHAYAEQFAHHDPVLRIDMRGLEG